MRSSTVGDYSEKPLRLLGLHSTLVPNLFGLFRRQEQSRTIGLPFDILDSAHRLLAANPKYSLSVQSVNVHMFINSGESYEVHGRAVCEMLCIDRRLDYLLPQYVEGIGGDSHLQPR